MSRPKSPIEILFDKANLKCTVCGAAYGRCQCWVKCACGWSHLQGEKCRNGACKEAKR